MFAKPKKYKGIRTHNTCEVFRHDGKSLDPCNWLINHSPDGFNWGYSGSGPAQLALAILVHQLGYKSKKALEYYQAFKEVKIATIQNDTWEMDYNDVLNFLKDIE
jgi:hypothetical protein